jgi:hypothetical protein
LENQYLHGDYKNPDSYNPKNDPIRLDLSQIQYAGRIGVEKDFKVSSNTSLTAGVIYGKDQGYGATFGFKINLA